MTAFLVDCPCIVQYLHELKMFTAGKNSYGIRNLVTDGKHT